MDERERDTMARLVLQVEELSRSNMVLAKELERKEQELRWACQQIKRVHKLTERPWNPARKYDTDEERVEAKRQQWRASKQRQRGHVNGR